MTGAVTGYTAEPRRFSRLHDFLIELRSRHTGGTASSADASGVARQEGITITAGQKNRPGADVLPDV